MIKIRNKKEIKGKIISFKNIGKKHNGVPDFIEKKYTESIFKSFNMDWARKKSKTTGDTKNDPEPLSEFTLKKNETRNKYCLGISSSYRYLGDTEEKKGIIHVHTTREFNGFDQIDMEKKILFNRYKQSTDN